MNTLQDHVTNKSVACVNEPTHEEEFRFSPSTSYVPLSSTRVSVNRANEGQSNDSLKLHISNIANDVTEEEVLQMINEAIGVEQVRNIKCLVPPWKDLSSLDHISFKVEIENDYRETVLKTSTWPKEYDAESLSTLGIEPGDQCVDRGSLHVICFNLIEQNSCCY